MEKELKSNGEKTDNDGSATGSTEVLHPAGRIVAWAIFGPWFSYLGILLLVCLPLFVILYVAGINKTEEICREDIKVEKEFREQRISEVAAAYNRGSDTDLMIILGRVVRSLILQYDQLYRGVYSDVEAAQAEEAAAQTKLGLLHSILSIHPEITNDDFRIIKINENVSYTNGNKKVDIDTIIEAEYAYSKPSEPVFFKTFIEIGLNPPYSSSVNLEVVNLINGRKYDNQELRITPIGSNGGQSPYFCISIPTDPITGFGKNGAVKYHIRNSGDQPIPYSIWDIHAHRYTRGIENINVKLNFNPAILARVVGFKSETCELIYDIKEKELFEGYIDTENTTITNGRYENLSLNIRNPKGSIAVIFYMFSDKLFDKVSTPKLEDVFNS